MAHRRGPPQSESTPICRCRVLYLGSSVPHITKDGLQGIQEPLRELYPSEGISGAKGIDSWLSVWSNGLLLENVDEKQKKFTRFFPIEVLHYCAAVRYVLVPASSGSEKERVARFLPLDSPFARSPSIAHPPLFAAILRRTTGIKVLECHVFICKRETPANALVRCCFHAYADSMQARQMDGGLYGSIYGTLPGGRPAQATSAQSVAEAQIDVIEKVEEWQAEQATPPLANGGAAPENGQGDELSVYNGDKNHKVWAGSGRSEREVVYNEYELAGRGASVYGSTGSRAAPIDTEVKKKVRKQKVRGERGSPASPSRVNSHGHAMNGHGHAMNGHGHAMNGHGHTMNGHGHAMNGHVHAVNGYGHGMNGHGQIMNGHGPGPSMNGHSHATNGHGMGGPPQRSASALNMASRQERSPRGERPAHLYPPQLVYGTLPPPPHMQAVPLPPMMPGYGPAVMTLPYPVRPGSRAVEEPTYLPSARPLSPTASYQPGHFPHEAYLLQQQYATVDRRRKVRRKPRKEATESPPNTGIYKRRNHLNEKAFGFSIQQEHRSRSYGSLANLEGGEARPHSRNEARKSREMQQMMHELDLSADELERSEVRPGMYRGPDSVSQLSHHSHHSGFRRL
ncbi:uncharacterized protein LOC119111516 [Pollicipes pollicipes]|uniref:uncharacterized protein LOC119111516 n=1 Tax=Pollicipes pollicipes TaxID=41117 RepID=UPI0018851238|nr:uncharacterized protein LOC119111516 [Pollicipes pollicipes]